MSKFRVIVLIFIFWNCALSGKAQKDSVFIYEIYYPASMPFDFGESGPVFNFPDSLPSGLWVQYHQSDSSTIAQKGRFVEGKKHGEFMIYNKDGTLAEISYYQHGVLDSSVSYYSATNRVATKRLYHTSLLNTEFAWFDNGNPKYEISNEHQKFYYANGNAKMEKWLRGGAINGPVRIWDEEGKLLVECVWKNGKPDSCLYRDRTVHYKRLPKKYRAMNEYTRLLTPVINQE